jgi:hypothetical protein
VSYENRSWEFILQPGSHVIKRFHNNQSTSTSPECEYIQHSRNVWKSTTVNAVVEVPVREGMGSAVGKSQMVNVLKTA